MGLEQQLEIPVLTTTVEKRSTLAWKSAIWPVTFGTVLPCHRDDGVSCSRTTSRASAPRWLRHGCAVADLIYRVSLSRKMAPVLRRIYDQMPEPKWVISMGVRPRSAAFDSRHVQASTRWCRSTFVRPPARPESLICCTVQPQKKIAESKL
jgi:NADH-quinone oxidoreductase subunit B